ncbi:SET domain-containing protein [Macroventuria anomochaeta]|uniref:SET domain-containing protein n=1 Tax=Macroventuria anomochaeta TaxID=301207 RepID=A0ACB6RVZ6_9PLEO|nr:SET domain-containing protein [Macroventuria anomochaeta]KAF2625939.1 SET domain-containing protein [Macroventuria anomochaeta]
MAERDGSPLSTSSMLSNNAVQHTSARATSSASPPISTPPTSLDDGASVMSEITKLEQTTELYEEASATPLADAQDSTPLPAHDTSNSEGRRPSRSSRKSVITYNVQILAGTAIHTPTKYLEKHHTNVLHGSLEELATKSNDTPAKKRTPKPKVNATGAIDSAEEQLAAETAQALRRRTSSRGTDLRKEALRNLTGVGEAVATSLAGGKSFVSKGLRRSASDSHLKSATSSASPSSSRRPRTTTDTADEDDTDATSEQKEYLKPKTKAWLKQGLYVGQHRDFDARLSETQNRAKKRSRMKKESGVLPLPMFAGGRLLNEDPRHVYRHFKLPFDTYNPLPRKVKVDGWVKLSKNRFIGDASALWKRDKQDSSQCYCDPEDGCGEACHNRIMAYECDSTNCRLTPEECGNRPFAELKRRGKGNGYDYGVEVMETEGRGYGVRAMRTFQPHQIIVEYAGEIITQSECERRMKQIYKKDKCYYLMSFDNKMIIDATRGTIARFVNHSCEPNCEMIKWTFGGEPRMALFAGSRGVMTGEELTYDYNFDPFSQKNIQECRCGTESCRGVLGPKPKKPVEERSIASAFIAGTKRKLQDFLGSGRARSESNADSPKKRKIYMGNSATTKVKNLDAATKAAHEQAEVDAAEHSRQIASREDRALKRSSALTASKRLRPTIMRRTVKGSLKSTRTTTVSLQRKVVKPGALKAVNKSARMHAAARRINSAMNGRKGLAPSKRPSTPTSDSDVKDDDSDEDTSPNITPASLRSASKDGRKRVFNFDSDSQATPPRLNAKRGEATRATAVNKIRSTQQKLASTPRSLHDTGAGVKKSFHPAQSRPRTMRGR